MPTDQPAPLASRLIDIAAALVSDAKHASTDTIALTLADQVIREMTRIIDESRANSSADRVYLMRELAGEVEADFARRVVAAKENGGVCGIRTGFRHLDSILNGWEPGRVYLLGAASSIGKTSMCLQWASYAAQQGHRALYISFENSRRDLRIKNVCRTGNLSYYHYLHGVLRPDEWAAASRRVDEEIGDRLALYCPDLEARPLVTVMEEAMQRMGGTPELVVVDYLQKAATGLAGRAADDERQAIGRYIAAMRQVAQQYNCAVLAISSLNRASNGSAGKGNRGADLQAFMGSAAIEYGADVGMLLFEEESDAPIAAQNQSPLKRLNLQIIKNREGKRSGPMPLEFYGDICLFQEEDRHAGGFR